MKHHYFFRRTVQTDTTTETEPFKYFRYRLVGLAQLDTSGLDIYLHYFNSAFTKPIHSQDQPSRISRFFRIFLRLFLLKCLYFRTPEVSTVDEISRIIEKQLFKAHYDQLSKQQTETLTIFSKQEAGKFRADYSTILGKGKLSEQQIRDNYQSNAIKIHNAITELLQNSSQQLTKHIEDIRKIEELPSKLNPNEDVITYLMQNYSRINNIEILPGEHKILLLRKLVKDNQQIVGIRIPFLDSEPKKEPTFIEIKKGNAKQEPILIGLGDLATHRKRIKEDSVWNMMSQKIITCCANYHNMTEKHLIYPRLTPNDFFFNQQNLEVGMTYEKLVLDALGLLHPKIKNVEAQLVFEPTPYFNQEECWLETVLSHSISLRRKYFIRQQQDSSRDVEERIHVWRIIDLLFFFHNGKHLAQYFYQIKYPKQIPNFKDLQHVKKQVYQDIEKGKISVSDLISSPINNGIKEGKPFQFSLTFLSIYMGYQKQEELDSIILSLRSQKPIYFLRQRNVLFKQIFELLTQELFFKGLINSKKYIILLLLSYFEEMQYMRASCCTYIDNQMIKEEKEARRKRIEELIKKLKDYQARNIADENCKFIKNQPGLYSKITSIHQRFRQALQLQAKIIVHNKEAKKNNQKVFQDSQKIDKQLMRPIENSIIQVKSALQLFLSVAINPFLAKPENFHPKQNQPNWWRQYSLYLNLKLILLIKIELWLNTQNCHQYVTLCSPSLIDSRKIKDKLDALSMGKDDVGILKARLEIVQNWMERHSQK